MLYWLLVFGAFIVFLALSHFMMNWMRSKKIKINRFVWAVAAFLVVMIPKAIFPHMGNVWSGVLYILCGVFALNFMTEQHRWVSTSKYFNNKTDK